MTGANRVQAQQRASFETRRGLSLAVLAGALGLDLSGLGLLNAALPSVGAEFALADATLQLTMTAYAVTFAGLLLLAGRSADVFGHRTVFSLGVAAFTVAAFVCAVAPTVEVLIAARAVQGIGAALSAPAALALLAAVFPEGPARNRAMSVYASVGAASFSAGVVLGGLLTGLFGWRWVLVFSVVVGAVVLAGIGAFLPPGNRRRQQLDLPGTALVTAGLLLAVFGVSNGGAKGWTEPVTVGTLAPAVVLLVAFLLWERRAPDPLLPLTIFRSVPLRISGLAALLNYTAGVGLLFFAPLYMQGVLGYSAAASGLAVVPSSVILFLTATFVTGRMLSRWGPRPPMIVGLALIGTAMTAWTFTPVDGDYWRHLLPGLLLTGVGQGLVFPAMTVGSLTRVATHLHGVAGALNVTAQQIGSSVGVAALVAIAAVAAAPGTNGALAGYHAAYLAAAALSFAGALVIAFTRSGWGAEQ
ncbi:MFS transporter [Micromonospora sp. NPDC000663]|uniref:MFS transporter n=1 Tax=Micromonospora sp. NPDC000663 TaxID=3364218 RepID=UPI0036B808E9